MKRTTFAFVLLGLTLIGGSSARAQVRVVEARRIHGHAHHQLERIRQGWRQGDLTRLEARRLLAEQARIRAEARVYRHTGGGIGPREALDLRRDLGRSSRHIYIQRHDARSRI
jgi:hypothetical protein